MSTSHWVRTPPPSPPSAQMRRVMGCEFVIGSTRNPVEPASPGRRDCPLQGGAEPHEVGEAGGVPCSCGLKDADDCAAQAVQQPFMPLGVLHHFGAIEARAERGCVCIGA